MADLTNTQGTTPVELVNESSGNIVVVNTDGSLNIAGINTSVPSTVNISSFVADGKVFSVKLEAPVQSYVLVDLWRHCDRSVTYAYTYR